MFGLEKNPKPVFEMDLEKEIKKDPQKLQELIQNTEQRIQEIKGSLREGSKGSDFDQLGTLLYGYTALLKILKKLSYKK